ncbi:transglycosylase family protein [Isoptericola jiangsuensis]|uniref:transglycosylase family protein n=1 Tax=Isoptericola jiangsuensis TaxID=548579 RepID=UPI003AAB1867
MPRPPRIAAALATLTAAALVPLTVAPASAAPAVPAISTSPVTAVVPTPATTAAGRVQAASRSTVRWVKVDRAKVTTMRNRSSRVVARPDDGTRVVVVGRSAKLLKVKVGSKTGWIGKKAVTTTRLTDVTGKRFTTGRVKVTQQIGTKSRTVGHVALGTEVKRLARTTGRDTNRVKVRIPGGRTGWVSASRLTQRDVWRQLAQCESGGRAGISTGNGYHGMYQFTARTWRSVGGSGLPHHHSAAEQTKRAQILQARAGWGQWPHCTRKLGLR